MYIVSPDPGQLLRRCQFLDAVLRARLFFKAAMLESG